MPRHRMLDEHAADIVAAYLAGATMQNIADQHGTSRQPVERILREAGVQIRRRGGPEARPMPPADELAVAYEDAGTLLELARRYDVHARTIKRWFAAVGIDHDDRPGRKRKPGSE